MNDSILNAGLLALMVAVGAAACVSPEPMSRRKAAATVDMPVLMLPAVAITGKRVPAADSAVAAAPQVVHLPLVSVQGRRTPAMEPVALAQAE